MIGLCSEVKNRCTRWFCQAKIDKPLKADSMKKLLVVVLIIFCVGIVRAQKTADLGIWGGTGTSFGDMTQITLKSSLGVNYGAYLRYNINTRVAARLQVMNGSMKSEGFFDGNAWSFGPKNVTSLSLMGEVNFLRYLIGNAPTPFTTYLMGGVGVSMFPYDFDAVKLTPVVQYIDPTAKAGNVFALQIPLGFGVKYNLGKKFAVGMEVMMNKYLDDRLDDLDDPRSYEYIDANGNKTLQTYNTNGHNNDYAVYCGLHLCYKINLSRKACPVYEYE